MAARKTESWVLHMFVSGVLLNMTPSVAFCFLCILLLQSSSADSFQIKNLHQLTFGFTASTPKFR